MSKTLLHSLFYKYFYTYDIVIHTHLPYADTSSTSHNFFPPDANTSYLPGNFYINNFITTYIPLPTCDHPRTKNLSKIKNYHIYLPRCKQHTYATYSPYIAKKHIFSPPIPSDYAPKISSPLLARPQFFLYVDFLPN